MALKLEKKRSIKQQIVNAAQVYASKLAGRSFLYVYGDHFIEVLFKTDKFLHLTGVQSNLSAKNFYHHAKKGTLDLNQFYFTKGHPLSNASQKLPCLNALPRITTEDVIILNDLTTVTLVYRLALTNLEFTLGLMENLDANGSKLDDKMIPRSLRVHDKAVERSADGEFVDFIFEKGADKSVYQTMTFSDHNKVIPQTIIHLIDPSFFE